jgi:hypothetical protein
MARLFCKLADYHIDRQGPSEIRSKRQEMEVEPDVCLISKPRSRDPNNIIKQRAESVRHFPLFSEIPPEDCERIVAVAYERSYRRRKTIFIEGDPVRQIVFLTSGAVKLSQTGPQGQEVILRMTDLDCVVGCRRLVQSEAILAGGSLGECLWAVETGEGADTPRRNLRAHFSRPRRTL